MAEIALVIVANANRDEVENTLGKELNRTLVESNDEPKFRTAWDLLQTNVKSFQIRIYLKELRHFYYTSIFYLMLIKAFFR